MVSDPLFIQAQQLHQAGQLPEAERIYRQILSSEPSHTGAMHLLGLLLFQSGKKMDGLVLAVRAAEMQQNNGAYWANVGAMCRQGKNFDGAAEAYKKSLALAPNVAAVWNNFGNLQADSEEFAEAINSFRKALSLDPDQPNTQINLAKAMMESGDFAAGFREFRIGLEKQPSGAEHTNLLLNLHYPDGPTPEEIFAEHVKFNEIYAKSLRPVQAMHHSDRTPDRPLRIGYVSADFCHHPVARLLDPLLAKHNHREFIVHCYSNTEPDRVLKHLRGFSDHWEDTRALSDEALARMIIDHKIDILIDLSGHTSGNRLLVFARKPAPVQVTCLGYPDTTGLDAIDYRLTDALREPPGWGERFAVEKAYVLPETAWCYLSAGNFLNPQPPSALRNGFITFGCMSNVRKVTPAMIGVWAEILKHLPTARLAIAVGSPGNSVREGKRRVIQQFANQGVDSSRLNLIERCSYDEYLRALGAIDIALDTFPYHGGVTTLDTLWMGTPTITLAGPTYVSRVGVSILTLMGLQDLIADTKEKYIEIAVGLAHDLSRLTDLHATLREKLLHSPLMNAERYTRHFEAALRKMWHTYCSSSKER